MLSPLTILKYLYAMNQLVCWNKMTLIEGKDYSSQKKYIFKVTTGLSSPRFDYKDFLGSNKLVVKLFARFLEVAINNTA